MSSSRRSGLFYKEKQFERLTPTPLTPEKFCNTCLLILEKEKEKSSDITQEGILKNMLDAFSNIKAKIKSRTDTINDWKEFEVVIENCISAIKKPNQECAERLQLLMQSPLQRMKDFALSVNLKPSI